MNKGELKKKIVEVVNQWHMFQNRDMNGHTIWLTNDSEKLADALIDAVIGDVETTRKNSQRERRIIMLKIKESEWNRFCANARELGYKLDGKKYIEIGLSEKQLRIDTNTKRIAIVSNNKPYISTYDKLLDLITQGYVEKELAEERNDD